MNYGIRQTANGWELVNLTTGAVVGATTVGGSDAPARVQRAGYDEMVTQLSALIGAGQLAAEPAEGDGLLAEAWTSDQGIGFAEDTGDGRDFTRVEWEWRDPAATLVPLMLQTTTDFSHMGAELAGFVEQFTNASGTVAAGGRFYDNDAGRNFRDLLLGGRRFGVSMDCTGADYEEICDAMDDYGWCNEGHIEFTRYEIGGLTGTPFPAFDKASIILEGDASEVDALAAAGGAAGGTAAREAAAVALNASGAGPTFPVRPPREWLFVDPPMTDDDPRLVLQPPDELGNEYYAVPLTMLTDDSGNPTGAFYGSVEAPGVCHTGVAASGGGCITAPTSPTGYARFHLGATVCADGTTVPTGVLVAGADHAPLTADAQGCRDHHAAVSLQWADCRVVDTPYGPFACGALRPDVTPELVRALNGSSLSGEYRDEGRGLDMILASSVSSPGYPIFREALAASGGRQIRIAPPRTGVRVLDGSVVAMNGGRPVVRPGAQLARPGGCGCGGNASHRHGGAEGELLALMRMVEARTRPLVKDAADHALARLGGAR